MSPEFFHAQHLSDTPSLSSNQMLVGIVSLYPFRTVCSLSNETGERERPYIIASRVPAASSHPTVSLAPRRLSGSRCRPRRIYSPHQDHLAAELPAVLGVNPGPENHLRVPVSSSRVTNIVPSRPLGCCLAMGQPATTAKSSSPRHSTSAQVITSEGRPGLTNCMRCPLG